MAAKRDRPVDLLIIGAGGCGLMAALVGAHRGAEVLVLEKSDRHGGGTALSHRGLRAAGSRFQRAAGIEDDPTGYAEEILERNGGRSDPEVTRALAVVSARMVEFLADHVGVDFEIDGFSFGQGAARSHVWSQDAPITDLMFEAVRQQPRIEVRFSAVVDALQQDTTGGVTGVVLDDGSTVPAAAVLLAAGGFGASDAFLVEHIPRAVGVAHPGYDANTGDGIRMGIAAGGALAHMDSFQPYPAHVGPAKRGVPPNVILDGGIVVARSGRRFVDETRYPGGLADAILDLPGKRAFEVFDQRVFDANADGRGPRSIVGMLEDDVLRRAGSASELAEALGVDARGLDETIRSVNDSVGRTDPLGRTVGEPLRAPYYGIPITVALYHTQGGLRVDAHGRVLRLDGSVVAGLYAGGGAAAGISGDGMDGYLPGNGLLASLGLGMLAAEHTIAAMD